MQKKDSTFHIDIIDKNVVFGKQKKHHYNNISGVFLYKLLSIKPYNRAFQKSESVAKKQ